MTDAFPAIESYAFLSDGTVMALVAPSGAVEWMCLPRPDAPSVFGAVLDRGAGHVVMGPAHDPGSPRPDATERRYMPGTLVLESTWRTSAGSVTVVDALVTDPDLSARGCLTWIARCMDGAVDVELDCAPRPDYGRRWTAWATDTQATDGAPSIARSGDAEGGPALDLVSDRAIGVAEGRVVARHRLVAGASWVVSLRWGAAPAPAAEPEARSAIETTAAAWRTWLSSGTIPDHPWRPILERSALTLKGLIYTPTGAPLAAATTSLPEAIGGGRNWDYRYAWLRDGVFTLAALQDLGFGQEARRFLRFISERIAGGRELRIMYGIEGQEELPEATLDHLGGYRGSRPVRIGNAAISQRQHDVWGAYLHLVWRDVVGEGELDATTWALVERQVQNARAAWPRPDRGVWEVRGEPRHFTSSKVMGWVALDRGARLAQLDGRADLAAVWRAEADTIRADVLAHGLDARGSLTQSYGSDQLDASNLLAPLLGFLPPDDPRMRATVLAVADELTEDGLVLRYRTETTDDGLEGEEGSFTICSFWLVSALARIGEVDRARALMERLLALAGPLGLYAEEIEPRTGAHLGNMPQAFSHLALIGAALDLIASEQP